MTAEQLLLLATIVLLPLIDAVLRRIAQWREAAPIPKTAAVRSPDGSPPVFRPVRTREHSPGLPSPTAAPLVAPRRQARPRLGSLREVRRGIVVMAILGPCRGLESREPRS